MEYAHSCNKIFGWTLDSLQITVQQYQCKDLYAAGRMEVATVSLLQILNTFGEEVHTSKATAECILGEYWHESQVAMNNMFQISRKNVLRIEMLKGLRDTDLSSGKYKEVIAQYTSALSSSPLNSIDILVKWPRSRAWASNGLRDDALMDANKMCALCHIGQ